MRLSASTATLGRWPPYAANFPDAAVCGSDAASLTGGDLLQMAGTRSCVVVVGGPPCAAFSVAGKMSPDDARRGLIDEFARLVAEVSPDYFVMENVPGILAARSRDVVDRFRGAMTRAGYVLAEPWLLAADGFGVPQRRRRVFMVGARRGLRLPRRPEHSAQPPPGAFAAMGDLEALEAVAAAGFDGPGPPPGLLGRCPSRYAAALRCDGAAVARVQRPGAVALSGCERVRHTAAVIERFAATEPGATEPVSRLRRLHPDRPAPTLRAGTLPEHGSHTAARPIHYRFARCITVREAARLQSMPDWFALDRTKWRGYMQVGNSVPPLLARAVAAAVWRSVA